MSRPTRRPPIAWQAIVSIACSCMLCCPLTSLLGMAFGAAGMLATRGPAPAQRGRRLAVAGLLLGSAGLVVQMLLLDWYSSLYQSRVDESMHRTIDGIMSAAATGDAQGSASLWVADQPAVRGPELRAFGETTERRYGPFVGMSIVHREPGGTMLRPTMTVAATFRFERRDLPGAATFVLVPVMDGIMPEVRLERLHLDDGADGAVTLPPG